jgi:hypothetical protein
MSGKLFMGSEVSYARIVNKSLNAAVLISYVRHRLHDCSSVGEIGLRVKVAGAFEGNMTSTDTVNGPPLAQ